MFDNYCECGHMEEDHNWEMAEYGPDGKAPCAACLSCANYRYSYQKPWKLAVEPPPRKRHDSR